MKDKESEKKDLYVQSALEKSDHPYFKRYQKVHHGKLTLNGKEKMYSLICREDPFGTHTCIISEERARRSIDIGRVISEVLPQEKCTFCPPKIYELTPEPRISHGYAKKGNQDYEILSIPNLYPFSPDHYVTVFSYHKPNLTDLTFEDIVNYINSLYTLAQKFREGNALGIWDFINWGSLAGASQSHPHAQRGPIIPEMTGLDAILIDSVKESRLISKLSYRIGGEDPYGYCLEQLRKSDLFIWESKEENGIFIHAPFAPKFPHQVDVVVKKKIGNILQLEKEEREMAARCMLGIFHALAQKLEVTDLNVVTHQELFHLSERSSYRLHWHFMPRNLNRLAGFETGFGSYITPFLPEETADVLRKHYK